MVEGDYLVQVQVNGNFIPYYQYLNSEHATIYVRIIFYSNFIFFSINHYFEIAGILLSRLYFRTLLQLLRFHQ